MWTQRSNSDIRISVSNGGFYESGYVILSWTTNNNKCKESLQCLSLGTWCSLWKMKVRLKHRAAAFLCVRSHGDWTNNHSSLGWVIVHMEEVKLFHHRVHLQSDFTTVWSTCSSVQHPHMLQTDWTARLIHSLFYDDKRDLVAFRIIRIILSLGCLTGKVAFVQLADLLNIEVITLKSRPHPLRSICPALYLSAPSRLLCRLVQHRWDGKTDGRLFYSFES